MNDVVDTCKTQDCLIGYIGIKVCDNDPVPDSGMYINSLPGISLESIDRIASADQITYKGLWNDIQNEAQQEFFIDFAGEVSKCFQLTPYCDYWEIICNNKCWITNPWRYLLGYKLMIYRLYSSRLNRFTTIDAKQAEKLRDFYFGEYKDALKLAMKMIDVQNCCMPCAGNPEYVVWLP